MNFIRKHRTASKIVLIALIIFLFVGVAFGRFIKNVLSNYILETQGFYFYSSILDVNDKKYMINNWDGVNSYPLNIDIKNYKNDEKITKTDISYTIGVDCPTSVVCTLSKTGGVLRTADKTDSYQITVTPQQNFYEGNTVQVKTYVTSSTPYRKTISATYTIGVAKSDFSYNIVDSANAKFLTINFINAISYYEVSNAFGDYAAGDQVSLDDYNNLTPTQQANCFSAIVTVTFDPTILLVDMTDKSFRGRLQANYQEQTIGGYQYVKKFSFKVPASSNTSIIFYKDDPTQNYSYSGIGNSIISVSVIKAN